MIATMVQCVLVSAAVTLFICWFSKYLEKEVEKHNKNKDDKDEE